MKDGFYLADPVNTITKSCRMVAWQEGLLKMVLL